jgi:hypothetical protein
VRHVYVHAGGKIEALGTGLWAAPRGTAGAVGDIVETTTGTGMMTVESVCAVDVRDNTEMNPDPMGMLMTPRASAGTTKMGGSTLDGGATSGGGGATMGASTLQPNGGKKDKRQEEKERKEAELKAKLAEKEQKKMLVGCRH